jgi:hypothetical protein
VLFPFIVEPRSAVAVAALPLAILAGYGLADFVLPKIASLASGKMMDNMDLSGLMAGSKAVRLVMGYVLFSAFLGAYAYDLALAKYIVPESGREAMQWIKTNTPSDGQFLVLTGGTDPFSDPTTEWFPLYAMRASENTIQGQEWTLARQFMPFLNDISTLQSCLNASPACLEDWAAQHRLKFGYVYLEKAMDNNSPGPSGLLLYQLRQSPSYSLVFENTGTAIFERK